MTTRKCPRCGAAIEFLDDECGGCGADLAIEMEIAAFHQPAIDSARKMIIWAGLYYPLIPVAMFAMLARIAGAGVFATSAFALTFAVGVALFAGHLGLWWWARKSPLPATLIAMGVFVAYVGVTGIGDGLVIKVLVFAVLARAVLASNRARKLRANAAGPELAAMVDQRLRA
jgi:hypothetical protein